MRTFVDGTLTFVGSFFPGRLARPAVGPTSGLWLSAASKLIPSSLSALMFRVDGTVLGALLSEKIFLLLWGR